MLPLRLVAALWLASCRHRVRGWMLARSSRERWGHDGNDITDHAREHLLRSMARSVVHPARMTRNGD